MRRAVIILTLSLLAGLVCTFRISQVVRSDLELLFFDDFNDGVADGWTAHSGSWSVQSGEYRVSVPGIVETGISTADATNFTDCTIETNIRFEDAVGFRAEIVFRWIDSEHFYTFGLSNEYNVAFLAIYSPGQTDYGSIIAHSGGDGSYPTETGINYLLKVDIQQNHFRCSVNNAELFSGTHSAYGSGQVGLRARRADAHFDNFTVNSIEIHDIAVMDITPSQDVIPQGSNLDINVTVANQRNFTETFNLTLSAYQHLINTTGLVGYWKFDEGIGSISYDSSGFENNGTLVGGCSWVEGKYGKALSFDGVDDYVKIPHSSSLNITNEITVEAWVKPQYTNYQGTPTKVIVGKHGGWHNRGWSIGAKHGDLQDVRFHWQAGSDNYLDTQENPLSTEVWTHVVGVANGTHIKIYINGILSSTKVNGESVDFDYPIEIGRNGVAAGSNFHGVIDEVCIFNRALSQEEIGSQYFSDITIQTKVVTLLSENSSTVTFTWNTTDFDGGDYLLSAHATPVDGEILIYNNLCFDGIVSIITFHDIALTEIMLSRIVAGQNFTTEVMVIIENQGTYEDNFNVTVYANNLPIHLANITLSRGENLTLNFGWSVSAEMFEMGNYTISANVTIAYDESNITDNTIVADDEVCVTFPGDIDADFDVDIFDVVGIAGYYGEILPPIWPIPPEDVDGDGDVDIFDIVSAISHYGKTHP